MGIPFFGTPVVALFGPVVPENTTPLFDPTQHIALTKSYHCAPCKQNLFKECQSSPSGKPNCLEDLSVRERFEAAFRMIPPH